ncbi:PadR family transcriptional regulator [Clostridium zeae]|uniref:PadR family transcriptional regulator n=1 Tax=Clostridium zeae TaxID=2759022 RepID=A0ABQ1E976_9CLOT|nr:PadR family transcriptional regulator [Clostridium zeae]GFZ31324.1 PadR family transcriptional regulator [Clostridium zeae]
MDFDKEILKGYIDMMILSVLKEKDMYGYEIAKTIKERSSIDYEIKEATLYVSLKRLEKKNCLEGYWNDSEGTGGGRRRYYRITEEGKIFFKDRVNEWGILKKLVDNFIRED